VEGKAAWADPTAPPHTVPWTRRRLLRLLTAFSRHLCPFSRECFWNVLEKFPRPLKTEINRVQSRLARRRRWQTSYFESHFQWHGNPRRLLVLQVVPDVSIVIYSDNFVPGALEQ
jgi:hypothetical protein